MKKFTVYNVYLDDGDNVYKIVVPAENEEEAAKYCEGNGSGAGKQTGVDQWQRNEKTREYLKYFPADAVIRKGVITNAPELIK